jgi:hypothetical protein
VSRSAVDLILILIGVSLLISPVPPTVVRQEIAPPVGAHAAPTGVSLPDRSTVDGEHAGESSELAPGTPPEAVAPPAHDPVSTRQSKTPTVMRGALSADAPSYFVRIGPISESNAAEIIRRLAAAHYSVRNAGQTEPQRFRVVSAPMPRNDALHLASSLAQKDFPSLVRSRTDDQVELQFGVFNMQGNAEDLAGRIQDRGYSPIVVREGAVRIIAGGPYSAASLKAIIKTVESAMSNHPLTIVPCGAQDPLIHAWRGWVQVCRRPPSDR